MTACLFKNITYKRYSAGEERDVSSRIDSGPSYASGNAWDAAETARETPDGLERRLVSPFPAYLGCTRRDRFKNARDERRKRAGKAGNGVRARTPSAINSC
ncbi:hypothetical protein X777_07347 [Ooceraea biroi]|uniref:Uncharacterized protein n=1 Tax=Ooceraea biroi TaxID=2015173 RepID=A0A026X1P3_OOCBI|nr:hypothetical protein X777_07347 [Ooceraea biroi]